MASVAQRLAQAEALVKSLNETLAQTKAALDAERLESARIKDELAAEKLKTGNLATQLASKIEQLQAAEARIAQLEQQHAADLQEIERLKAIIVSLTRQDPPDPTDPPPDAPVAQSVIPTSIPILESTSGLIATLTFSPSGTYDNPVLTGADASLFSIAMLNATQAGLTLTAPHAPGTLNLSVSVDNVDDVTSAALPLSVIVASTDASAITSFTVENWGSSPSSGFLRFGLPTVEHDLPEGTFAQIRRNGTPVAAQFDERVPWPDESLEMAVGHLRDTPLSAGEIRTYEVFRVEGEFDNTGSKTLGDITGSNNLNLHFSNMKQYGNFAPTTFSQVSTQTPAFAADTVEIEFYVSVAARYAIGVNPDATGGTLIAAGTGSAPTKVAVTPGHKLAVIRQSGTGNATVNVAQGAVRGSGAAVASFNAHAAVPTRVWKYHIGDVCESWEVWGMARDGADGSGSADTHLKVKWYPSIWKNADGSIAGIELGALNCLDWWSVQGKYRLTYDCVLKDGDDVIETYSAVSHLYQSQWLTVRKNADNNYTKRHWITGSAAMPTLTYKPNKLYWRSTGMIPAIDHNYTPLPNSANYPGVWTPCGPINHRPFVDATGGYLGRGMVPDTDSRAFMRQTAEDYKIARSNAHAGLHVPFHFMSNRTRQRPASAGVPGGDASPDTANTVISLILQPKTAAEYTFTNQGMPIPVHAYGAGLAAAAVKDGFVTPLGGVLPWGISDNDTHGVGYSYFMYLLEGERYFMQATLDHALKISNYTNGNIYSSVGRPPYYDLVNYRTAFSIPNVTWSGLADLCTSSYSRKFGWTMMHLAHAWAVCPDNDVQRGFIEAYVNHNLDYFRKYLDTMPASQLASGGIFAGAGPDSPWMTNFCGLGSYMLYGVKKSIKAKEMAEHFAKHAVGQVSTHIARMDEYRCGVRKNTETWAPGTNEFHAAADIPTNSWRCSIAASSNVLTRLAWGSSYQVRNGDKLYPVTYADQVFTAVPAELTAGETLYVINATSPATPTYPRTTITSPPSTFQVSRTPGGAAIDFAVDYPFANFNYFADSQDDPTVVTVSSPDSYTNICGALIHEAAHNGYAPAVAVLPKLNTYLAGINDTNWTTWRLRHVA